MSRVRTGKVVLRGIDADGQDATIELDVDNGAASVGLQFFAAGIQNGEKTEYGSSTMTASGSGAIIDTADISDMDEISFKITGLTSETVALAFYLDEAKTLLTAAVTPIDLATGALAAGAAALPNGSFKISGLSARFARFTKSSTTETPTITYLARG